MKKILIFLVVILQTVVLPAQTSPTVKIDLRDGNSIDVASLRRAGGSIIVPLADGKGEIGYAIAKIARINFPEPRQIAEAEAQLTEGKAAEAVTSIDPIVTFHAPFRDIEGNYYSPAAFLKMKALLALQRNAEAAALLDQIAAGGDPLFADRVKVERASALVRNGKNEDAMPIFDEVIDRSTDPETLANAWLNKGRAFLAMKKFDPALTAFLHLPVFYSDENSLQPAALLGSAQSWLGMEDVTNARSAFEELINQFPKSPEAIEAAKQIKLL